MAHSFKEIDGLIEITFTGELSADDLIEASVTMAEIESKSEVTPDRITDLTTVDRINLHFSSVEALAAKRRAARLQNNVKSAIVVSSQLHYGFARMYQTLNDNPSTTIAIFWERKHALNWIAGGALEGNGSHPPA